MWVEPYMFRDTHMWMRSYVSYVFGDTRIESVTAFYTQHAFLWIEI